MTKIPLCSHVLSLRIHENFYLVQQKAGEKTRTKQLTIRGDLLSPHPFYCRVSFFCFAYPTHCLGAWKRFGSTDTHKASYLRHPQGWSAFIFVIFASCLDL